MARRQRPRVASLVWARGDGAVIGESFWQALAIVLVIEGLLPFVSPKRWRSTFQQILTMSDGQIRFFGLCSIVIGLVSLALLI